MVICNIFKETKIRISNKQIEKTVNAVFAHENRTGEVGVHVVSDEVIKELNSKYRGFYKVTDVLSFAAQEGHSLPGVDNIDWGDIFISLPQITRQAKEYGVSLQAEFNRMLVHGVLHLFGYDHQDKKSEKVMFGIQDGIISSL